MQYPIIDLITSAYLNNGWTGLDISTGKNLWNPENVRAESAQAPFTRENDTYTMTWNSGVKSFSNKGFNLFEAGTYALSFWGDNTSNIMAYFYNENMKLIGRVDGPGGSAVLNEPFYIGIGGNYLEPGTAVFKIQLETGSTITPYEPYTTPTTDIFSRIRLPLIRYFPHPVIDSLQRASDGSMTADDVQILRHYLTKFGIGNIELGRFNAITPNISDDIRKIDLEPIPIDDQIKEKKTGEEDLNVKTE